MSDSGSHLNTASENGTYFELAVGLAIELSVIIIVTLLYCIIRNVLPIREANEEEEKKAEAILRDAKMDYAADFQAKGTRQLQLEDSFLFSTCFTTRLAFENSEGIAHLALLFLAQTTGFVELYLCTAIFLWVRYPIWVFSRHRTPDFVQERSVNQLPIQTTYMEHATAVDHDNSESNNHGDQQHRETSSNNLKEDSEDERVHHGSDLDGDTGDQQERETSSNNVKEDSEDVKVHHGSEFDGDTGDQQERESSSNKEDHDRNEAASIIERRKSKVASKRIMIGYWRGEARFFFLKSTAKSCATITLCVMCSLLAQVLDTHSPKALDPQPLNQKRSLAPKYLGLSKSPTIHRSTTSFGAEYLGKIALGRTFEHQEEPEFVRVTTTGNLECSSNTIDTHDSESRKDQSLFLTIREFKNFKSGSCSECIKELIKRRDLGHSEP